MTTAQFGKFILVRLAQSSYSTITDLADTLTLELHILGNLGQRLMITVEAEKSADNTPLALCQRQQGKLNGVLYSLGKDATVGHGRVWIDKHGEQTHIRTAFHRRVNGHRPS